MWCLRIDGALLTKTSVGNSPGQPFRDQVEKFSTLANATHDRTKAILEQIISKRFLALAMDDDGQAEDYERMARKIWKFYDDTIRMRKEPLKFEPLPEMEKDFLQRLLSPDSRFNPELKARLQTKLEIKGVPAGNSSTNAPGAKP